jgi:hypothetical protein
MTRVTREIQLPEGVDANIVMSKAKAIHELFEDSNFGEFMCSMAIALGISVSGIMDTRTGCEQAFTWFDRMAREIGFGDGNLSGGAPKGTKLQ